MRRTAHMSVLWFFALLLPALSFTAAAENLDGNFFHQTLGDLHEELALAREQNKRGVLIFFEQEECPWCHRMKNSVFNQPEVQSYFRDRFLIFSFDIESPFEVTDFKGESTTQQKFFETVARNRGATPVFAFFDLEGDLVVRFTGATTGVEEFLWLGEYASEGAYQDTTFSRYKRAKRKNAQEG